MYERNPFIFFHTIFYDILKIFSDKLSSLQAIHTFSTKHLLALAIKNKLKHLCGLLYLAHVPSHTGATSNERAYVLANDKYKIEKKCQ